MENFLSIDQDRILFKNEFFFVIKDAFPVSPGHLLVISNTVRRDYFDLTQEERAHLDEAIHLAKTIVEAEFQPDGYNLGMNCGTAAGQTVPHFHLHLIPRYHGDTSNPRGGVRGVIPGKQSY